MASENAQKWTTINKFLLNKKPNCVKLTKPDYE